MNKSGLRYFHETSRDKRKKFAYKHQYSDFRVLVGHWFDERARYEAETELMLYKLDRNELSFQKLDRYFGTVSRPLQLTRNLDGFLHHGDLVRIKWTAGLDSERPKRARNSSADSFFLAALPFNIKEDGTFSEPCPATATSDSRVVARSAFRVFRNQNTVPNHVPIIYGECIIICTGDRTGHRLLDSEPRTFSNFAKKSGHQEVKFVEELSGRSLWKVLGDGRNWMSEGKKFVPSNTDVIICHVVTGRNLAFEEDTKLNTVFGIEKEVAAHSYVDRNKLTTEKNFWQFEAPLIKPEDYSEPIRFPKEGS